MTPELPTGEETVVYGDSGYLGAEKREDAVKKQTAKLNMMFALANLILADRPCLAARLLMPRKRKA